MISGTTRLGGLLGSPVSHSLSPAIHNESFRVLGLDYVYLCFDIGKDALPDVVRAFREMNVFGFNLTMPVKEAVMALLDELTPAASLIHAVNTVCNENGRLTGYNTDGIGFMRSVREAGADPAGKEMTLMGCGGAAQAIAFQAALDGTKELRGILAGLENGIILLSTPEGEMRIERKAASLVRPWVDLEGIEDVDLSEDGSSETDSTEA